MSNIFRNSAVLALALLAGAAIIAEPAVARSYNGDRSGHAWNKGAYDNGAHNNKRAYNDSYRSHGRSHGQGSAYNGRHSYQGLPEVYLPRRGIGIVIR
jgi:hypothetical protein